MALRFAILQQTMARQRRIVEGKTVEREVVTEQVVLEYDDTQVRERLKARVRELLVDKESWMKRAHTRADIDKAIDSAFQGLVTEFKEETVKLV